MNDLYEGISLAKSNISVFGSTGFKEHLLKELIDLKKNPLLFVLENNLVEKGAWLEFGVFLGNTINKIADYTEGTVYGFDSFEGLPDIWDLGESIVQKGHYSYTDFAKDSSLANSNTPKVKDNVTLVEGLFSETLSTFKIKDPITFIHVDCDLYTSTKDIFDYLGCRIKNNCIIVFDEFINYPNYRNHEFKAFYEWVNENNIEYEFIGMNGEYIINPEKVFPASDQKVALRIINNPGYIMDDIALVVNTHSSCSDVWPMFFDRLKKHFPNKKVYVISDIKEGLPSYCHVLKYSEDDDYRTQFLKGIKQVSEEFCINFNEDYIFYSDVDKDKLQYCFDYLKKNENLSFVRLFRGIEYEEPEIAPNIYLMNNQNMWFFSQMSSLWRTRDLEVIHEHSPKSGMAFKKAGPQMELVGNDTCRKLNTKGVFYYAGEPKRGIHHHDSSVLPFIASAIVKGKWNLSEYPAELGSMLEEYGINPNIRGIH